MPHIVVCKERFWQVLYDTAVFRRDDAPTPVPLLSDLGCDYRMGVSNHGMAHYSNATMGMMPAGHSFLVHGLGLRLNLQGPVAEDMARMILQSAILSLEVANKAYMTVPAGALVPPGLGVNALQLLGQLASKDFDHEGQLWANEAVDVLGDGLIRYFPSDGGYPVGSRKVLDIQLDLKDGEVQVEESNDGESWVPVYTFDSVRNVSVGWCGAHDGVSLWKLGRSCTSARVRLRWQPYAAGASIKATVMTCNAMCASPTSALAELYADAPEVIRSGSFCRVMPTVLPITLPPRQPYHALLRFAGVDLPALRRAHAEGLLRGELTVLMPGRRAREIM